MNKAKQTTDVIKALMVRMVGHPDDLKLLTQELERSVIVAVICHADDYGKLCGERGKHLKAFTVIGDQILHGTGKRVIVDLCEPATGTKGEPDKFKAVEGKTKWLEDLASVVFGAMFDDGVAFAVKGNQRIIITVWAAEYHSDLEQALITIFRAVGAANGQKVFLDYVVSEKEEAQPAVNKGRFAS